MLGSILEGIKMMRADLSGMKAEMEDMRKEMKGREEEWKREWKRWSNRLEGLEEKGKETDRRLEVLEATEKGKGNGWERQKIRRLERELEMKERREREGRT